MVRLAGDGELTGVRLAPVVALREDSAG